MRFFCIYLIIYNALVESQQCSFSVALLKHNEALPEYVKIIELCAHQGDLGYPIQHLRTTVLTVNQKNVQNVKSSYKIMI